MGRSTHQNSSEKVDIKRMIVSESAVKAVLDGRKRAVRRNSRYADPGDEFALRGHSFEIMQVYRQTVGDMTDADAQDEGFESMRAYKDYIVGIHKGMVWRPDAKVWVHEFEPVADNGSPA